MQKGDWQAISSLSLFLLPVHFACFEEGLIGPHSKQTPGRATGLGVPACHMQVNSDRELILLPGKSHGWRSMVGCSPWGR